MENLYIVYKDVTKFKGTVLNTMPFVEKEAKNGTDILNSTFVHYTDGVTFKEYNEINGGDLVALTWDEFDRDYYRPHLNSLQEDFKETTEARFWDGLECLPPKRWTREEGREFFFIGECYTATLYRAFVRIGEKYYTALRSITAPKEDLFNLKSVN